MDGTLHMKYSRGAQPKTQAQVLAEQEVSAVLPADLQAMLDAARTERQASEARMNAGKIEGGAT